MRLHGGEAAETVARYGKRSRTDRAALFDILRSLTAAARGREGAAIEAIQARSRDQAAPDPRESPGRSGIPAPH